MPGDPWPYPIYSSVPSLWAAQPQRNVLKFDDIRRALRYAYRAGQSDPSATDEDAVINGLFAAMLDGKEL